MHDQDFTIHTSKNIKSSLDIIRRQDHAPKGIITSLEKKFKKELEKKGVRIESSSVEWAAKEEVDVNEKTKKRCHELFELLDGLESVQEIYSNLKS